MAVTGTAATSVDSFSCSAYGTGPATGYEIILELTADHTSEYTADVLLLYEADYTDFSLTVAI